VTSDRPRVEFDLPGTTTDELRRWAQRIEVENPIGVGFAPFAPVTGLVITDQPLAGVELSFVMDQRPVFTLAIFATHLTNEEKQIMESGDEREG
jgi:hypothetical protein